MTNQQQLHTAQLKTSNNTHETNYNRNVQKVKKHPSKRVQFLVICTDVLINWKVTGLVTNAH